MDRRLFLMSSLGLLAGCAAAPVVAPPVAVAPPSTPPPPVPPMPPDMAGFLNGPDPVLSPTGDAAFDAYVRRVLDEGGSAWRPYLLRVLDGVQPDRRILDQYMTERSMWVTGVADYIAALVTPERVAEGRRLVQASPALKQVSARAGVPAEVLAAYWGAASDYGRQHGQHDLITTLMTLGAYGKGPAWADWNIYYATQMIAQGRVSRERATSFADGSMGQLRWYPEHYLRWAVDGDGDGRVDIWNSAPDVVASIGNQLGRGWEAGAPWVYEVLPPKLDPNNPMDARRIRGNSYQAGMLLRADGKPWRAEELTQYGELVWPPSAPGRVFMTFRNFAPLAYSSGTIPIQDADEQQAWGIAVGLLANRIREG
jgi:membrane-bound lytic murein transglycosylase B